MIMDYKFIGEKGSRKVVKTVEIHEESYEAIKKMISSGKNMTDDIPGPLLDDTYNIFGGNCYDMLVSLAVESLIGMVVHELQDKKYLSVEGEVAFRKISDTLFPSMAFTNDEDGCVDDELKFFEINPDEVINGVANVLEDGIHKMFVKNLKKAVKNDNRPVGEIALGILMYISSEVSVEVNDTPVN